MKKTKNFKDIKIDFGSGYNPKEGYLTCDITYSPFIDFVYDAKTNKILDLEKESVKEFYLKNVLHHTNIENIAKCLNFYLKKDGIIRVTEPKVENYETNRCLDIFWYRYIYPRYEYDIPPKKRIDYVEIFKKYFKIKDYKCDNIYDYYVFKK